jgi:hypothetical protein
MIGQNRREKEEIYSEYSFYSNILVIRPIEKVARLLNNFYSIDNRRILKQFTFILLILTIIYTTKLLISDYLIPLIIFH